MSVCIRMEQHGFHWTDFHKIWYEHFWKSVGKNSSFIKILQKAGTLHEYLHTFMVIPRWIRLTMRNVSGKSCRQNRKTHFMSNKVFPKIGPFMATWRNMVQPERPQMTILRMRFACRITKLRIQTHTKYLSLTASSQQQWLSERASMLRHTYTACLV